MREEKFWIVLVMYAITAETHNRPEVDKRLSEYRCYECGGIVRLYKTIRQRLNPDGSYHSKGACVECGLVQWSNRIYVTPDTERVTWKYQLLFDYFCSIRHVIIKADGLYFITKKWRTPTRGMIWYG